jgi:hypothetical protein
MRPGLRAAEAKGNPHMKVAPRSWRTQSVSSGAGAAWSIYSRGTAEVFPAQSNSVRQASRTAGVTAYIRALAIKGIVSSVAQSMSDAEPSRFLQHGVTKSDVGKRKAAMPEENCLVVALPAWFAAGDDLAHFRVQRRLR